MYSFNFLFIVVIGNSFKIYLIRQQVVFQSLLEEIQICLKYMTIEQQESNHFIVKYVSQNSKIKIRISHSRVFKLWLIWLIHHWSVPIVLWQSSKASALLLQIRRKYWFFSVLVYQGYIIRCCFIVVCVLFCYNTCISWTLEKTKGHIWFTLTKLGSTFNTHFI